MNKIMIKFCWRSESRIQIRIATLARRSLAEVCTVPQLVVYIDLDVKPWHNRSFFFAVITCTVTLCVDTGPQFQFHMAALVSARLVHSVQRRWRASPATLSLSSRITSTDGNHRCYVQANRKSWIHGNREFAVIFHGCVVFTWKTQNYWWQILHIWPRKGWKSVSKYPSA